MADDKIALDWHPSYRAHVEFALWEEGVLNPLVENDGSITCLVQERDDDGEWIEYRADYVSEDTSGIIVNACAMADAASGLTTGCEVVERLSDLYGIEGGKAQFEDVRETHLSNLLYISKSAKHVARRLSAQARGKNWDWDC